MTWQRPDLVLLMGDRMSLFAEPFAGHPAALRLPDTGFRSNRLWRGHVAEWDVARDRLYLMRVYVPTGRGADTPKRSDQVLTADLDADDGLGLEAVPMADLFTGGGPVHADWVSGRFVAGDWPDPFAVLPLRRFTLYVEDGALLGVDETWTTA